MANEKLDIFEREKRENIDELIKKKNGEISAQDTKERVKKE